MKNVALPLLAALALTPLRTWAQDAGFPAEDLPQLSGGDREDETTSQGTSDESTTPEAALTLRVQAAERGWGKQDLLGMVLLSLPLGRVHSSGTSRRGLLPVAQQVGDSTARVSEQPARPPPDLQISSSVSRRAIERALRRAHLLDVDQQIDSLASRSRISSWFPELRLRVSRVIDEGETLSPTEYDPYRMTRAGTVTSWLEARATWRLDRVIFSDNEVALERLRDDRAEARRKLTGAVIQRLFQWERGRARALNPSLSPEEQWAAAIDATEQEVSLDEMTGGWFSSWVENQSSSQSQPTR